VARSCNGRAKGTEGGEHGGGGRERKDDSWKFEARITYASSRFAELPGVSRSFHVMLVSFLLFLFLFQSRLGHSELMAESTRTIALDHFAPQGVYDESLDDVQIQLLPAKRGVLSPCHHKFSICKPD